jgi:hypothetical protein
VYILLSLAARRKSIDGCVELSVSGVVDESSKKERVRRMKYVKAQDHRETSVCSDVDVAVGRKVRLWWGLSASRVKENSEACEGSALNDVSSQERRENNGAAGEKNMSKMWDVCV